MCSTATALPVILELTPHDNLYLAVLIQLHNKRCLAEHFSWPQWLRGAPS